MLRISLAAHVASGKYSILHSALENARKAAFWPAALASLLSPPPPLRRPASPVPSAIRVPMPLLFTEHGPAARCSGFAAAAPLNAARAPGVDQPPPWPAVDQRCVYKWFHDSIVARLASADFLGAVQATAAQPFDTFYAPESLADETLVFESRFECGNLLDAFQVGPFAYDLRLRRDLFTSRHTQWFYFRIQNTRAGRTYRLNIVNFHKADSLFSRGMQPVFHSRAEHEATGAGWFRDGQSISYVAASRKDQKGRADRVLSFSFTAKHDADTLFVASAYPYSYSDLRWFLHGAQSDARTGRFLKRRTLCQTRAGNDCDLLTITDFDDALPVAQAKRGVFLTARVHPGESVSSWIMKGVLDFLLGSDPDADTMRHHFVFKIIPMLNPDGVIVGNSRANLTGVDLNRCYKKTHELMHPTIYHAKEVLADFQRDRNVVLYCDLHGHSKKLNTFLYGCHNLDHPTLRFTERVFPRIICHNDPGRFCFGDCKYGIARAKRGTGRVVLCKQFGILNSYTLEASLCGSSATGQQFTPGDYEQMGRSLCDSLLDLGDPNTSKVARLLASVKREIARKIRRRGKLSETQVVNLEQKIDSDIDSNPEASDSSDDDELVTSCSAPELASSDALPAPQPLPSTATPAASSRAVLVPRASDAGKQRRSAQPVAAPAAQPRVASRLFYIPKRMRPKSSARAPAEPAAGSQRLVAPVDAVPAPIITPASKPLSTKLAAKKPV